MKRLPKFAILNNNYVGDVPHCLGILSETELAYITPVKLFGYIVSYTGGKHLQLRGSLSFYKVRKHLIARGITQL